MKTAHAAKPALTLASRGILQRKCACGSPDSKGSCPKCEREEKPLQRRAANNESGPAPSIPPVVHDVLNSPGRPLDAQTRSFMEPRFGHDFGGVRVHTDSRAAESARAVSAHAYTVGNNIVFDSGKYNPRSESGQHLLAHELTHTIQQQGMQRSAAGDLHLDSASKFAGLEREADTVASHVMNTAAPAPLPVTSNLRTPVISRQPNTERDWTGVRNRQITANSRNFTVDREQAGPGTQPGSVPRSVAFRVDPFYLPASKGDVLDAWNQKASANALESTLNFEVSDSQPFTSLAQSRAPATAPTGTESSLTENWLLKQRWPSSCAGSLWHRAGGDPRRGTANAPVAPNSTVAVNAFPFVSGTRCHVDHIVDLQLSGSNVPSNLQMLDEGNNVDAGREIREQLRQLSIAIRDTFWPSGARPTEIVLHFQSVRRVGGQPNRCSSNPCTGTSRGHASMCWQVECCAQNMGSDVIQDVCGTTPAGGAAGAAPALEDYPLRAGGLSATLRVPPRTASDQTIDLGPQQPAGAAAAAPPAAAGGAPGAAPAPVAGGAAENRAAAELIPGLILNRLHYVRSSAASSRPDTIDGEVDMRAFQGAADRRRRTRTPSSLQGAGSQVVLVVNKPDGQLRLRNPGARVGFVYPYLSDGSMQLAQEGSGEVTGRGTIISSLPVLRGFPLNITFARGELSGNIPVPQRYLRLPIPGVRITRAEIGIELSPQFRPYGLLAFEVGRSGSPIITGSLTAEADQNGLVLLGQVNAHLPRIDQAQGNIEYRNDHWSGFVLIESTQIRLPGVERGSLRIDFTDRDYQVTGTVALQLPGGNTAELQVHRRGHSLVFTGRGVFHVRGLRPVTLNIEYDGTNLTATGRTGIEIQGLTGDLSVTYRNGHFSGEGQLTVNKGRARGRIVVRLSPAQRFSGEGTIQYQISENLIATAGIELHEDQSVRLSGALEFPRPIPLFGSISNHYEFFNRSIDIPILGVSIGPVSVGLIARITGAMGADYGIGPGEIRNVRIAAALNPLEENPDLDLQMSGRLVIPAHAGLYISVRGGLGVSAGIASVTGGITATGRVGLRGGLEAGVDVRYRQNRFSLDAFAEISATPVLSLSLDADVTAEAGAWGFTIRRSKVWHLASFEYGSGMRFGLRAPLHYASNEAFHAPSISDIQWITPNINVSDVVGQLIDRATGSEREG
ncbi:MAG TPA: DUF4157 domain-containing protein [Pyrinomonadaceae bacterium]